MSPKVSHGACFRVRPALVLSFSFSSMPGDELSHFPELDFDPQTHQLGACIRHVACHLPPHLPFPLPRRLHSILTPFSFLVGASSFSLSSLTLASAGSPRALINRIFFIFTFTFYFRSDRELPIGQAREDLLSSQPARIDRAFTRRAVHAPVFTQLSTHPRWSVRSMYVDHLPARRVPS